MKLSLSLPPPPPPLSASPCSALTSSQIVHLLSVCPVCLLVLYFSPLYLCLHFAMPACLSLYLCVYNLPLSVDLTRLPSVLPFVSLSLSLSLSAHAGLNSELSVHGSVCLSAGVSVSLGPRVFLCVCVCVCVCLCLPSCSPVRPSVCMHSDLYVCLYSALTVYPML